MFNQIEDMMVNTLVQKLNAHGLNVDAETVKKAIANSPQIIQQVESILLASSSDERLAKISALISAAAKGDSPETK
jgi:hypothetical protein